MAAVAVAVLLAAALTAPLPGAAAAVAYTRLPSLGGHGHAGLYAWGAETRKDGSVLLSDYWNFRIAHFNKDGSTPPGGSTLIAQNAGPKPHRSPYDVAVDPVTDDIYFGDVDNNASIDKYDANGDYLGTFGSRGDGPNKFDYPAFLTVGSDQRVYVVDSRDHVVSIHAPNGNELDEFGGLGSGRGKFKNPRGIAVDAQDRLFVVDVDNKLIQVFNAEGEFQYQFGSGNGPAFSKNLRGIAVDKVRKWVYVVDAGAGYVNKYALGGKYLGRFGGPGTEEGQFVEGGRCITVDGDGNVWVADMPGFQAQVFSPEGQFLFSVPEPPEPPPLGGFAGPMGVAVHDASGNVFVADTINQRVQKFVPPPPGALEEGTWSEWGDRGRSSLGFNYPRGIAVDQRNSDVLLFDTDNIAVKKYTADGLFKWSATGLKGRALDVGPDGNIYVANAWRQSVVVLNDQGQRVKTIGGEVGTGDGQFLVPQGISLDADGSIWVADGERGDVQHFDTSGTYLGKVGAPGIADNQLADAADVETDATRVYVSDPLKNKVKVWNKNGTFVGVINGLRVPHGLHLTPDRKLHVIEQAGSKVSVFQLA